jgi:phosphatidate cytidylyltransferase
MPGRRLLVALVVLPALYLLIRYLPPMGFFLLVCVIVLIAQYEFYRLSEAVSRPWMLSAGLAFGVLTVWSLYQTVTPPLLGGIASGRLMATTISGLVISLLLCRLWLGRSLSTSLTESAVLIFGVLYIAWLLGHLVLLRGFDRGTDAILFVLLVTWVTDSAAYFGGRWLGRRPLAGRVSPSKTVEGAVAGLIGAAAAAALTGGWLLPSVTIGESLGLGLALGCLGQLGDLSESMFKRSAGVKDSGGWIPAHGGLLDKIDSLVFTAPAFYYYLVWFKGYGRFIL